MTKVLRYVDPVIDVGTPDGPGTGPGQEGNSATLGRRIRHFRLERDLTLEGLGRKVGVAPSQLSLIENGHREPRVSLLQEIAAVLDVTVAKLLDAAPPSRRAALEIALEQAQQGPVFAELGLPSVRPSKRVPTEVLETMVGLHAELARRAKAAIATPEEARRANTELRLWMRERDNYLPAIEDTAEDMLRTSGYAGGPLTHRTVARMANRLGFTLIHVDDLPHSTRTVTDLANGRIYLPPVSIPGGHGLRSLGLQAIAHRLLGHERPVNYADFLRQRVEINYFAAACLLPRTPALTFLTAAKKNRDLAVEDFRDAFGVTHETAAQRFTNLATSHLNLPVHFLRVSGGGSMVKGYENDGVRLPRDASGAIEGQPVCRNWAARMVFDQANKTTEFYQYTDTPEGTFWCTAQSGSMPELGFSISLGTPFAHAKWFRGRDTEHRMASTCPDERCCRRPDPDLTDRWADKAWPSATAHAQILAPLPTGIFPGVDDAEMYAFLERHADAGGRGAAK